MRFARGTFVLVHFYAFGGVPESVVPVGSISLSLEMMVVDGLPRVDTPSWISPNQDSFVPSPILLRRGYTSVQFECRVFEEDAAASVTCPRRICLLAGESFQID